MKGVSWISSRTPRIGDLRHLFGAPDTHRTGKLYKRQLRQDDYEALGLDYPKRLQQ